MGRIALILGHIKTAHTQGNDTMNVKDIVEFAAALIGLLTFGTVIGTVILLGMAL